MGSYSWLMPKWRHGVGDLSAMDEESVKLQKASQARSDIKRKGSLFQVRLDADMTAEMEHFMLKNGLNRNQALKQIIKDFFGK